MSDGKWIPDLTPDMPVADAARTVLAARFGVVRHYLPLAAEKPFEDVEYVHQLRVGTRRAGAALRVFADCLPVKPLRGTKKALRAIRRAAGGARDWDVFLERLPDGEKPSLDFLRGYALGERAAAQEVLARAYREHAAAFAERSSDLTDAAREPAADFGPLADLARARLGELLAAFDAAAAANPAEPAALHQLRILGKRARYAMELFAGCFAPPLKGELYPAVEEVQEILGGIQDATVGVERLTGLRDRAKLVMPRELKHVQAGLSAMIKAQRARIPAGKKAFQAWRAKWAKLAKEHPLDELRLVPAG
jgi:CHAD domain-containing protein